MSKNYKLWCYTEKNCPPCEMMDGYHEEKAKEKGYQYEEVLLERYWIDKAAQLDSWHGKPFPDFYATPWFKLENLDDGSTVDSFYGGIKKRIDIMMEK